MKWFLARNPNDILTAASFFAIWMSRGCFSYIMDLEIFFQNFWKFSLPVKESFILKIRFLRSGESSWPGSKKNRKFGNFFDDCFKFQASWYKNKPKDTPFIFRKKIQKKTLIESFFRSFTPYPLLWIWMMSFIVCFHYWYVLRSAV